MRTGKERSPSHFVDVISIYMYVQRPFLQSICIRCSKVSWSVLPFTWFGKDVSFFVNVGLFVCDRLILEIAFAIQYYLPVILIFSKWFHTRFSFRTLRFVCVIWFFDLYNFEVKKQRGHNFTIWWYSSSFVCRRYLYEGRVWYQVITRSFWSVAPFSHVSFYIKRLKTNRAIDVKPIRACLELFLKLLK